MACTINYQKKLPNEYKNWVYESSDQQGYSKYSTMMSDSSKRNKIILTIVLSVFSLSAYFIYLKCSKIGQQELKNLADGKITYYIKGSPKDLSLTKNSSARVKKTREIQKKYLEITKPEAKNKWMGHVNWLDGKFGLWMEGIAMIASSISKKHNIKGLYACQSLEGFSKELSKIVQNPKNSHAAFIVPTFCSGSQDHGKGFKPNFAQHKVAVLVEKKDGKLKIALIDSQPANNDSNKIDAKGEIWNDWENSGAFNQDEVIFRAILKANLDEKKTTLYHSTIKLEQNYGCAIFALLNAKTFLRNPRFFSEIETDDKKHTVIGKGLKIVPINVLPAEMMIGVQSVKTIKNYIQTHPQKSQKKLNGKVKNLTNYLEDNTVKVDGKDQNHYITWKMYKYYELLLEKLQSIKPENYTNEIKENFVL